MKEKVLNQRGITLIALIITIIILVILAAVSINAIANMGIVNHAVNGSQKYASESVKENKILGDTVNVIDSTLGKLENIQNGNASGESKQGAGTTGNDEYTEDDLRKYILGADETGRSLMDILDTKTFTFIADPANSNSTIHKNIKWGYGGTGDDIDENGNISIYIRYNKDVYQFTCDKNTYQTKTLTLLNSPTGHLGEYVTYGGVEYIVMAEEDSSTVTLISANALGTVPLGKDDSNATSNATDLNNDGTVSDGEKGVWSYNNAVNTLVTACKDATGLTVDGSTVISIRSAGNTNVKYTSSGISGTDAPGDYTYDYQKAGAESDWYTAKGFNNYHMKIEDTNYSSDLKTMKQLGIFAADDKETYWLASRCIVSDPYRVNFRMRYVHEIGAFKEDRYICGVDSGGNVYGSECSYAVRPVVTLSSSAISW